MSQSLFTGRRRILRANNVARRLGVSERTVRWYAETGQIPAFKIGRKIWFFHELDVEDFRHRRCAEGVVS